MCCGLDFYAVSPELPITLCKEIVLFGRDFENKEINWMVLSLY